MTVSVENFLGRQLVAPVGQPLRVAVYARLAEGIRSGVFPLGQLLPRETELAAQLKVSRTPMREALMLLEEDGLITTKRGIGRFVAEVLPHAGLELLQPIDVLLAEPGRPATVRATEFGVQPTTDFISNKLALDPAANTWFREGVVLRESEPIAIVMEHLPAGRYLSDVNTGLAEAIEDAASEPATLLAGLTRRCGQIFTAGVCQVTANIAGPTRAKLLRLKASDPVLVLTQTAEHEGTPVYLAKSVLTPNAGVSVLQSTPAA